MKKTIIISLLFVGIIGLFSCNQHEEEIAQLDELITQLDSAKALYHTIDTANIKIVYEDYLHTLKVLGKLYGEKDENWNLLTQFGAQKHGMKRYVKSISSMCEEYTYNRSQLENLKIDTKKGVFDEEEFVKLYNEEKDAVLVFKSRMMKLVEEASRSVMNWTDLRPKAYELIEFYSKKSEE